MYSVLRTIKSHTYKEADFEDYETRYIAQRLYLCSLVKFDQERDRCLAILNTAVNYRVLQNMGNLSASLKLLASHGGLRSMDLVR
jgi:hypothetical protein